MVLSLSLSLLIGLIPSLLDLLSAEHDDLREKAITACTGLTHNNTANVEACNGLGANKVRALSHTHTLFHSHYDPYTFSLLSCVKWIHLINLTVGRASLFFAFSLGCARSHWRADKEPSNRPKAPRIGSVEGPLPATVHHQNSFKAEVKQQPAARCVKFIPEISCVHIY